ncbi:MAG: ABC transporter permease [Acidimicrobiia bacterium]
MNANLLVGMRVEKKASVRRWFGVTFDQFRIHLLPFVVLILIWWLAKLAFDLDDRIIPWPTDLIAAAGELLQKGILIDYMSSTLVRILAACLVGIPLGIVLGMLLGLNRRVSRSLLPFFNFNQALSGIAWLPMAVIWMGFGEVTILALILYTLVFPIIFNTIVGVSSVPINLINATRVFGARRWYLYRSVWFPGALPSILTGVRLGVGYGWRALVGSEMIVASSGLGVLLFDSRGFQQTDRILLGMVLTGALWLATDHLFLRPVEAHTVQRWGMVHR